MALQTLVITSASPVDFIQRVLDAGKQGAVLKDRTCPRIKGVPFMAELVIETDKGIQSSPGVNALPLPESDKVYTKEDLEAMDWEAFKDAVQSKGIRGRQRDVMQVKYLQVTQQE